MKITRYIFVKKAPNRAKYGSNPPREGYINSWNEEIEPEDSMELEYLLESMEMEKQEAIKEYEDWLGYPPNLVEEIENYIYPTE